MELHLDLQEYVECAACMLGGCYRLFGDMVYLLSRIRDAITIMQNNCNDKIRINIDVHTSLFTVLLVNLRVCWV